jgi:hypothetical protein
MQAIRNAAIAIGLPLSQEDPSDDEMIASVVHRVYRCRIFLTFDNAVNRTTNLAPLITKPKTRIQLSNA